ncbi:MAG: GxxExxY protein [Novosphingobium sp.]|nr:GxxExxY protein [Novosphingobium sp.]
MDCGYRIHAELGPGLLESVYEIVLCESLKNRGLLFTRQCLPGRHSRREHLADRTEIHRAPCAGHAKQLLTYLRLLELPLGLLMNFGAASFKEGVRRIANNYYRPA